MKFKKYHVSKNLFDEKYPNIKVDTPTYRSIYVGDGTFTLSTTTAQYRSTANLFFLAGNVGSGASTQNNGVWNGNPRTVTAVDGYVTIAYRYYRGDEASDPMSNDVMLNSGSSALPYEPYGDLWSDTPYYIHKTDTDTLTILPAVLYPTAATATVGLKGQAVQSGTPTPDNPIMPEGCGERTGNLFDKDSATPVSLYYQEQREIIATNQYVVSIIIPVSPNTTYTFNNSTGNRNRICETETIPEINDTVINYISSDNVSITLTTSNDTHYILWWVGYQQAYSDIADTLSVNLGSTALPYEPYGFEISISSASTTTPVYLGVAETTRKIGKIDLGTLNWSKTQSGNFWVDTAISNCRIVGNEVIGNAICSHFTEVSANGVANTPYSFSSCLNSQARPFVNKTGFENMSATEFKEAMSGVYIYYVLKADETGIVNEPLMKIGDYADTLSNVSIPVTAGGDTLSVGTTVQPSEVSVSYKGWHPVQNVHKFVGGYTVGTMQALTIAQLQTHTISDLQEGEWL